MVTRRIQTHGVSSSPGSSGESSTRFGSVARNAPGRGVTSDQTIELTSKKGRKDCPIRLRRVGYRDAETGKRYAFLTNNFHLAPRTIADIYKTRWEVELFFKWIKQNLRIKSFLGTSRNAVLTQIWIAMCVHLILAYLKFSNRLKWSLSEVLRLLQLTLFERRTLNELLQPQRDPPKPTNAQYTLATCPGLWGHLSSIPEPVMGRPATERSERNGCGNGRRLAKSSNGYAASSVLHQNQARRPDFAIREPDARCFLSGNLEAGRLQRSYTWRGSRFFASPPSETRAACRTHNIFRTLRNDA